MSTPSRATSLDLARRPADKPLTLVIPNRLQLARNLLFASFPTQTGRRYLELLTGAVLLFAALTLLRAGNPGTSGLFPPCPFLWLTGWYCPGCGSLRALHQLLHGNLVAAFAFNPFAALSFPFLAYAGVSRALFLLQGRHLPRLFLPGWFIWGLGVAVVIFAVLRNLPMYPFHLLAPGEMLAQ